MEGNFFHILNRGVEKRKIFLDKEDYLRFVNNLYDFNDKERAFSYYKRRQKEKLAMRKPTFKEERREELVDLFCYSVMPNHHHILVLEKIDEGASVFSKKITSGYTQYFNLKNDRQGVLFQGRSKIILVERNPHFLYLPFQASSLDQ